MRETLVLMGDSATLVTFLKKQGGLVSLDMCRLAQEIIAWLELHIVSITVKYIPGKKNVLADQISHPDQILPPKWSRLPWVFDGICGEYGGHIATQANWNLPNYLLPILNQMA